MNKERVKHAREANIIDRIEIENTGKSFITLKDHKKNLSNRTTSRLLNATKKSDCQNKQKHITKYKHNFV